MFLSIDPSIRNVGVCLYTPLTEDFNWILINPVGITLELKIRTTAILINTWLKKKFNCSLDEIEVLVCEYPQFFNSQKGAVASKMGFTNDLACICGYMAGVCKFAKVKFLFPVQWKGQLTKHAIEQRFKRKFEDTTLPSEHEQEAAMLMLYYLENHEKI